MWCCTTFADSCMPIGKTERIPKTHKEHKLSAFCIIFTIFFAKSGCHVFSQAEHLEFLNLKFDYNCDLIRFQIWAKMICDLAV